VNAIAGRQSCRRDLLTLRRPGAKRDRAAPKVRIWHNLALMIGGTFDSRRPKQFGTFLTQCMVRPCVARDFLSTW
jgi:hypothetical protein